MAKRKYLQQVTLLPDEGKVKVIWCTEFTDGRGKAKRVVGVERKAENYDETTIDECKDELVKKAFKLMG